jgi:hypothetical protein
LGDFGERGHRNIMDIFVKIIGEKIWFLFFPSLSPDSGKGAAENIQISLSRISSPIIFSDYG